MRFLLILVDKFYPFLFNIDLFPSLGFLSCFLINFFHSVELVKIFSSYFFYNALGAVPEAGCHHHLIYSLFYLINGTMTRGTLISSPTFLFLLLSGMLEDCIVLLLEVRHSCMGVEPIKRSRSEIRHF